MKKFCMLLLALAALLILASCPAAADYTVSAGDELQISGVAQGDPGYLRYYVFGTNYFTQGKVSVDDAAYTIKLNTNGLSNGEYLIVIQHPMYDKLFNVQVDEENGLTGKVYATTADHKLASTPQQMSSINTRQNANAAYALVDLINLEYHDDACTVEKFTVTSPALMITSENNTVVEGSDFTISGTTNLKSGTLVTVEILSTAFSGVSKVDASDSVYLVLETHVTAGYNGVNYWSVTAHNPALAPGEYRITAVTPNDGPSDGGKFTVIEKTAVPAVPAQTAQTAKTAVPTQTPAAEQSAQATASPASPGFCLPALLAGLAAGAAVLRRQ